MKTFIIYTTNIQGGFSFIDYPNAATHGRLYYSYGATPDTLLVGGVSAVTPLGFTINIPVSILLADETLRVRVELSEDGANFSPVATGEIKIGRAPNPQDLLSELQQKIEPGDTVTLHPSSLDSLENISVDKISNKVSVLNSTTTPLGVNQSFVGQWEDVKDYESLSILLRTDKASTPDGARIEWSDDGVTVRRYSVSTVSGSATQGFYFASPRQGRYYRANYQNDGQAQTVFVLQIIHNAVTPVGSIIPVLGPIDTAASGLLVKSVLSGQSSAGGTTFVNVKVNPSGTLETNVNQGSHDSLNANANIQVNNTDVAVSNPVPVSDSSQREYTHVVATVTASGDTTIHTPASGKSVRLHYLKVDRDPAATTVISKTKLGATEVYRAFDIDIRQTKTGPVNGALTINLSGTSNVLVTAILEEV